MSYKRLPQRGHSCCALALVAHLLIVPANAEVENGLGPLVVSAMRIPQAHSTVTSAVTVLDPKALESRGLLQLRDALNESPGVISTSTSGETGAVGSLFIRGTTIAYSQMVVDGMRLGVSSTSLGNILSASRVYDIGRLEILRGPQGAIYGGESIGGVLWMETTRGSGSPHGSISGEAGSFNSYSINAMHQGEVGKLSYFLSSGYEETANDAPKQGFHQDRVAMRVEGKVNDVWTLGTTFRGADSYYENGGASDERVNTALTTLQATGVISNCWTARFHLGFQQECYDSDSIWGNYGTDMRAIAISTDHNITINDQLRLLANVFVHHDSYDSASNDTYSKTIISDQARDRYGMGAALEWNATDKLTTSAALRWEDYDAYGSELTWRLGSIYNFTYTGTAIRSGVGTSFRSPTYLDLFGSSYAAGNPNLSAESALGWDVGVTQKLTEHHQIDVTWFRNSIDEQIKTSGIIPVNIPGQSITEGMEMGMRGGWLDRTIEYRVAWTLLNKSLSDQPRNVVNGSIDWKPTARSMVGIGVSHLSEHSWGFKPIDAYSLMRVYGSYQLTDFLKVHARIENVLNEDYELYRPISQWGGPTVKGSGTGVYTGLTFDW